MTTDYPTKEFLAENFGHCSIAVTPEPQIQPTRSRTRGAPQPKWESVLATRLKERFPYAFMVMCPWQELTFCIGSDEETKLHQIVRVFDRHASKAGVHDPKLVAIFVNITQMEMPVLWSPGRQGNLMGQITFE